MRWKLITWEAFGKFHFLRYTSSSGSWKKFICQRIKQEDVKFRSVIICFPGGYKSHLKTKMEKLREFNLEFLRLQAEYLNNIRKQIDSTGECKLSSDDARKIDMR